VPERALALGAAGVLEAPVGAAELGRVLERYPPAQPGAHDAPAR